MLFHFIFLIIIFFHFCISHTFIRLGKQDENEKSPYNQNEKAECKLNPFRI